MTDAERTAPATALRPNATLAAAVISQMLAAAGFIGFSVLAPEFANLTGLNERDFGISVTFFFLGTALSSPFSGVLVQRLGSVRTLVVIKLFMAAGYLVCLAGTWSALMLAAFLFGIGYGPQGPVSMAVVTQRTPSDRRGLFLSIRQAGQPFAAAVGARILPPLMAFAGWQAGVYGIVGGLVAGSVFVLLAAPLFRLRHTSDPVGTRARFSLVSLLSGVAGLLRVPQGLRLLWIVGFVFAITQISIMVFTYLYLLEVVGLSAIAAGIFLSNQQLASMLGRPVFGWLCDVTGRSGYVLAVIALMIVATILGLLAVTVTTPTWLLVVLAIATGLSGQTWNAVFATAMSYRVAPERLVEMNGRAFSFLSFGWMAAPLLFWSLIEFSGGYEVPFLFILAANVLAAITLFIFGGARDEVHA